MSTKKKNSKRITFNPSLHTVQRKSSGGLVGLCCIGISVKGMSSMVYINATQFYRVVSISAVHLANMRWNTYDFCFATDFAGCYTLYRKFLG